MGKYDNIPQDLRDRVESATKEHEEVQAAAAVLLRRPEWLPKKRDTTDLYKSFPCLEDFTGAVKRTVAHSKWEVDRLHREVGRFTLGLPPSDD